MSERSRKRKQNEHIDIKSKLNMELKRVEPLSENQELVFKYRYDDLFMYGVAGTGKTFLGLYQAFDDVLDRSDFNRVVIIRSVVESRKMGFLPGDEEAKAAVYEAPYRAICTELFGRGDAYEYLKQKKIVEFETTSFLRGQTINDAVLVIDEFQNMTAHELDTVMTRVGKNVRVIVCGDARQNDLKQHREKSGAGDFLKIAQSMGRFKMVEFVFDDIVRSEFVKRYLMARMRLEDSGHIERL